MNKEEYKTYIEEQYKDDPEGFKIFLKMLSIGDGFLALTEEHIVKKFNTRQTCFKFFSN